jgi:xanthine dehydrogenase YagS FAD-binding subunit
MEAFDLIRPTTIDDAIRAAQRGRSRFIAGGTDLMQLMKDNVETPLHVIDVEGVLDDHVTLNDQGLRIGALARMSDVAAHVEIVRSYPVIAQALLASASPQLRNMATIGGNLLQRTRCGYFRDTGFPCNKRVEGSGCPAIGGENRLLAILGGSDTCIATHASDLAVALVALDATVELRHADGATRTVALVAFYREPGATPHLETVLQPGELITAITVPAHPLARRSAYLKVRDRASFEFALVSAAVALDIDGQLIREARIALGGVGTKPWRAQAAETALRGTPATGENFRRAAEIALQGARPATQNAFKVTLAQRAIVRALHSVA